MNREVHNSFDCPDEIFGKRTYFSDAVCLREYLFEVVDEVCHWRRYEKFIGHKAAGDETVWCMFGKYAGVGVE